MITFKRDELYDRMRLSFIRMHGPEYRLHIPGVRDVNGWPGDWEGRTILALATLGDVLGREPLYMDDILDWTFEAVGERGYFGAERSDLIDEQQLSGNGWFLRSMCEVYSRRGDVRALEVIKSCVRNLYLPLRGRFASYPSSPDKRVSGGEMAGNNAATVDGWTVSTDTGCAFISLDGLTAAYDIIGGAELDALLDEMISAFLSLDLLAIKAQTHATLTACRALLRRSKDRPELVKRTSELFALYKSRGMTLNFENYNWFDRPEWTEPCAVADSFIAARELYNATGDMKYLDDAQYIYWNGLRADQRANGGFGCNSCATPEEPVLGVNEGEAFWCCTMRGANVLSYIAENAVTFGGRSAFVSDFRNCRVEKDGMSLEIETEYPRGARTTIRYKNIDCVTYYRPSWAGTIRETRGDGVIELFIEPSLHAVNGVAARGPLLLDVNGDELDGAVGRRTLIK